MSMMTKTFKKILIQITMPTEAHEFIKNLKFKKIENTKQKYLAFFTLYRSELFDFELYLIVPNTCPQNNVPLVGTQIAGIVAMQGIELVNPDLIINAGTAGGRESNGSEIGDVYMAVKATFHAREYHPTDEQFKNYASGNYDLLFDTKLAASLKVKTGIVSSGDRMSLISEDMEDIIENNATIKDMEAASIALVATLYSIPLIVMKSITDIIDITNHTQEQFDKNFDIAVSNLNIKLKSLINSL